MPKAADMLERGHTALLLGLLAVSTSGPFFMMSQMSAYAAVFWRTSLGALVALGVAWRRGSLTRSGLRAHARGLVLSGALLGTHFLLWVRAFELTDFASNLILLVAQPVFAALLDVARGQALPARAPLVLALALLGILMVAGGDTTLGGRALLGDLCCVTAGFVGAVFFVVGRAARQALALDAYMGATLGVAALTALPVALAAQVELIDYPPASWCWLLGIVLVSTLVGHSLLNAAARTLSLFTVSFALLLEPVLSIALGALLFGAAVSGLQLVGGALLVASVALLISSSALTSVATPH